MGLVSQAFFQALADLQRAVQAELTGNAYYMATAQISELSGFAGSAGTVGLDDIGAGDIASTLASAHKSLEATLTGNQFYLTSSKLDLLASTLTCSGPRNGRAFHGRSFSELAAAAKGRVDTVASRLGVAPTSGGAGVTAAEAKTPAGDELERRSSEPCAMAELSPLPMEPVASAAISANKAVPAESDASGTRDLRSSTAGPRYEPAFGTNHAPRDSVSAAAKPAKAVENDKLRKPLFARWLNTLFGRNR